MNFHVDSFNQKSIQASFDGCEMNLRTTEDENYLTTCSMIA